jgi:hypothetical protein
MKNIILATNAFLLFAGSIVAQNATSQDISNYVPLHSYLKNNTTIVQNNTATVKSLADNEIAFRHDVWQGGGWAFYDSGSYAYNTQGVKTNSLTYNFVNAGLWNNNTNDVYTYDQGGNQLTHLSQTWDATNNRWTNESNYQITYSAADKPLTQTYQKWVGDGWQNTYNFIFTYDANNNLLQQVEQVWSTTANSWVNAQRSIQSSRSNLVLQLQVQSWDNTANNWSNYYQMVYAYDEVGNQTCRTEQLWQSSAWVNFYKDSTVYDGYHNATSLISQAFDAVNSVWVNRSMSNYTFDINKNVLQFAQFNWDTVNSLWAPSFLDTYTYNANNKMLDETETNWSVTTMSYVNAYKAEFTYDPNNNLTVFEDYYWGSTGDWVPNTLFQYMIDGNNKTVYELDKIYDSHLNEMVNTDQYYYYYTITAPTGISTLQNDLGAVLYPNPTGNNNINVNLTLGANSDITINTYDEQGKLINAEMRSGYNGANDMQLSYSELSSGIYFLQLINRTSEKTSVLKFVKN